MIKYYFLKEDLIALKEMVNNLEKKVIELGKEQGEVASQSTENFGHDDACQETVYQDRKVVIGRLNTMRQILNKAVFVELIGKTDKVRLGLIVELSDGNTYQIGSYRILTKHEIKNISYNSPLGQKLLSKEVGDEIVHQGTIIKIVSIR